MKLYNYMELHSFFDRLKDNFKRKIVNIFFPSVLGVQKNHLIQTVLLSTHYNACFSWEIRI